MVLNALQYFDVANSQETNQPTFAVNNRQDSRKTATAIKASMAQQQQLSGVQVTLFSTALRAQYSFECSIIRSRVIAGLIKVSPILKALYERKWSVKPSGDVDVIEKQQLINSMSAAWPVIQTTAAAPIFLSDMLEKMFPDSAAKYNAAIAKAEADKQGAQAQQQQQLMAAANQMGEGIVTLSEHREFFSEIGLIHAYPVVEEAANKFEQLKKEVTGES